MPFYTNYGAAMDGIPAAAAEKIQNENLAQENANQRVYADDARSRAMYGAIAGAVSQVGGAVKGVLKDKIKSRSELEKLATQHGYKLDELHQAALDKTNLYQDIIEGRKSVAQINADAKNYGSDVRLFGQQETNRNRLDVQGMRSQGKLDQMGAADTYKQNSLLNGADSAKTVRDQMKKENPDIAKHPSFQMFSSAVDGGDPAIIKEAGKGLFGSIRAEVLQSQKQHGVMDLQGQKDTAAMQRTQAQGAAKKTPNQTSTERQYSNLRKADLMNDVQRDTITGKPLMGPDRKTPLLTKGSQAELNRRMNAKRQIEQALQQGGSAAAYQAAQKLGITADQLDELEHQ